MRTKGRVDGRRPARRHRPPRSWSRRRCRPVDPGLGDVQQEADDGADEDEVEQHLNAEQDPRVVGSRCDVAEADGREDGDREVERAGVIEPLREGPGRRMGQVQVDAGEQDEEERDDDGERLGGAGARGARLR